MASGITSTARPTGLRLAGFVCVVLGAVIVGIGATRAWASVGFPADTEHRLDVQWVGTDVWEGKVVLFAALAALLVMIAMRISDSAATRRNLAVGLIVLGAVCIALPVTDAVRAEYRFGGPTGEDRLVQKLATDLELPVEVVQEQVSELLDQNLRVEISPGLWLTAAGGVLLVAGGILGLVWVRRESANEAVALDPGETGSA